MPMIYISKKALQLLEKLNSYLKGKSKASVRVVKSDIIYEALRYYAKKLEVEGGEDVA